MLEIKGLRKQFEDVVALKGVSFDVREGDIVALLGPSGSGKSTLLNLVAGLEEPDAGEMRWNGKDLKGAPPHERGFGLMFQDYALFPHRDVAGNVGFGLEMRGWEERESRARIAELLDLVGMRGYGDREVNELSGGEQQRVALARALAPEPRLLMLDEPLGSLDRRLRERLLGDLETILRTNKQTSLYVTHDQREAYAVADRIVLLEAGGVVQIGSPEEIYGQPNSRFVAQFLGLDNLLEGKVGIAGKGKVVHTILGAFPVPEGTPLGAVTLLLRPDRMRLDGTGQQQLNGTVVARRFQGKTIELEVNIHKALLRFEFAYGERIPEVGDTIEIGFNAYEAIQVIPNG